MYLAQLVRGKLSPVGEPIVLLADQSVADPWADCDYVPAFLNSGTAALSLAMTLAAQRREREVAQVILPAYGCPDLLAAAHFAGLQPVLVDIEPDSPRYQLAAVEAAITESTVAIVAVSLLGVSERLQALRALTEAHDLALIEDNAQYLPTAISSASYCGDLVVHSFGRGKPVSQLGGGVLLCGAGYGQALRQQARQLLPEALSEAQWRRKAHIFNAVLHPMLYQWLLRVPFLHIGATEYHALSAVECQKPWRAAYLFNNIAIYQARSRGVQVDLDRMLDNLPDIVNLPRALNSLQRPLLRYPILCPNRRARDRALEALDWRGLGGSAMYVSALPAIGGIPEALPGSFPGATRFADRLLTLPVTSFVQETHLQGMLAALQV